MRHEDFTMRNDGFAGHLAEPDGGSDRAVIVIMGGEQSILPGIKFAERFADYGITGLAVSLFGAEDLPDSPDRVFFDWFILTRTRFFQHFFPETEGCRGWKEFGFNRKQQIRQCILIPVCCLIIALICTFL